MNLKSSSLLAFGCAAALSLALPVTAQVTPTSGTLYYTTYSGGENVHKVDFNFNGLTLVLSNKVGLAATPGADGIVFTTDKFLAVGGQGGASYKVNPAGGNLWTAVSSGGTSAYHMMADPNGVVWSSGIPGTPAKYNGTLTVNGTAVPLHYATGAQAFVDTLTWTGTNPNTAFYTSSGSGGFGQFGSVDLSTGLATPILNNVPAAHGMSYDTYTGTLVLFGDSHITQIDPLTDTVVHDLPTSGGTWDQGTVDGNGHVFVANNDGNLLFMDLTASKNVAAPDFSSQQFLDSSLDDIAPLSGAGSSTPGVPDGGATVVLMGLGLSTLVLGRRMVGAVKLPSARASG